MRSKLARKSFQTLPYYKHRPYGQTTDGQKDGQTTDGQKDGHWRGETGGETEGRKNMDRKMNVRQARNLEGKTVEGNSMKVIARLAT